MSESRAPRPARVQAATVRVRDQYVEKHFGVAGQQRLRQAASPALRDFLASAEPKAGWVPFELFVEATSLADRLFGRGDMAMAWDIGRFAASHNIGVWKSLFMRHAPPGVLLGITSGLWSHHYDGGRLASRATGPSSVIVGILDFPEPHRAHCLSIAGWIQGSLELGPRKNILVQETACRTQGGALCEFRLSWE